MPHNKERARAMADAMFRAGMEACRQHKRYAALVAAGTDDDELDTVIPVVALCDRILADACDVYEKACGTKSQYADDAWWHRANRLWHAAREHVRHQWISDELSRPVGRHGAEKLSAMVFEHALEASAMLALRQSVDEYRAARPDADLLAAQSARSGEQQKRAAS